MKTATLLISFIVCCGLQLYAQSPNDLVRNDIILNKNKPTVSLCVDYEIKTDEENSKGRDSGFVWFRLHNNTVWALAFHSEQRGKSNLHGLADGRKIMALENNAVSMPRYQLKDIELAGEENKPSKPKAPIVKWGGVSNINWVLSGNSTVFKVPRSYFSARRLLLVAYKYQWEMIGTIGYESYSPQHEVNTWYESSDSKINSCDS